MKQLINLLSVFILVILSCSEQQKGFKWTQEYNSKITTNNLSQQQAVILASIVEKECDNSNELKKVSGVYINRLNLGIPLQSNECLQYVLKDTTIKYLTIDHLNIESPYNTFTKKGLPPSVICKPSKASIMAIINAEKHEYLYFIKRDSSYIYSRSLEEHKNSAIKALN